MLEKVMQKLPLFKTFLLVVTLSFSFAWGCGESLVKEELPIEVKQETNKEATQSPEPDEAKEKPKPQEPILEKGEGGQERNVDGGDLREKGLPDSAEKDTAIEKAPDSPPEAKPEVIPEPIKEAKAAIQAKAVSLLASFLQMNPQAGLMKQRTQGHIWESVLRVPKGSHQLIYRLDLQKQQRYGLAPTSTAWPLQGAFALSSSAFSVTFPKEGLYRFRVDLAQRNHSIEVVPLPQAVRMEGIWNGPAPQKQTLTRLADGRFEATLPLHYGAIKWRLALQFGGAWKSYGPRHVPRDIFPQGGEVIEGGKEVMVTIPFAGIYIMRYDPLERSYTLKVKPNPVAKSFQDLVNNLTKATGAANRKQYLDKFFASQAVSSGMPIISGTKAYFVLEWKAKAPVFIAGSFNQWSSKTHKMDQIPGTDIYHLSVTIPEGHHSYKFTDSSPTPQWILDPQSRGFEYGPHGPNSAFVVGNSKKGLLHYYGDVKATLLKNKRAVYVYLPPDYYKKPLRHYPVLYMHDGQNLFNPKAFYGGWGVDGWIDQLATMKGFDTPIIVGVANTPGRMDEYTHTPDKLGTETAGGKAKEYADFLLREVKPLIDGHYRTRPIGRYTGVMGSSLGGLISLWLGLNYTESFYRIGALSSTFGWGSYGMKNPTLLSIAQKTPRKNLVIYIDSGSPQDNYQVTLKMRDILSQKGYLFGLNFQHWVEVGAGHNEKAWRDRLIRPLTFLFSWNK